MHVQRVCVDVSVFAYTLFNIILSLSSSERHQTSNIYHVYLITLAYFITTIYIRILLFMPCFIVNPVCLSITKAE